MNIIKNVRWHSGLRDLCTLSIGVSRIFMQSLPTFLLHFDNKKDSISSNFFHSLITDFLWVALLWLKLEERIHTKAIFYRYKVILLSMCLERSTHPSSALGVNHSLLFDSLVWVHITLALHLCFRYDITKWCKIYTNTDSWFEKYQEKFGEKQWKVQKVEVPLAIFFQKINPFT